VLLQVTGRATVRADVHVHGQNRVVAAIRSHGTRLSPDELHAFAIGLRQIPFDGGDNRQCSSRLELPAELFRDRPRYDSCAWPWWIASAVSARVSS
jgi:hypothetical protein